MLNSRVSWQGPRRLLVVCAALDLLGLIALILGISFFEPVPLMQQLGWLLLTVLAYLGFGWLFGSYTVLRWRRLPIDALIRRVLVAGLVTLVTIAFVRWIVNPPDLIWLVYRRTQVIWLAGGMAWSLLIRAMLRRGVLLSSEPSYLLVGSPQQNRFALEAWNRTLPRQQLRSISLGQALDVAPPVVLAIPPAVQRDPRNGALMQALRDRDPRETVITTPIAIFERQLERLPPRLLPEPWLEFDELPWNRMFSLERQLKRAADLVLAVCLLTLSSPLMAVVALLIWLDDRGPVFYVQDRTGWLGQVFSLYKLRTMRVSPDDAPAQWTIPDDQRITRVGAWLRRLRLDELPQLINVLSGDMSLIGPRPERPELEHQLEQQIPHYRKRHWMRPGLSGWAQVSAPYAASVEDSQLKLSYDLYYLKHFSTWLDLVILLRTIKTVLKAGGR